MYFFACLCFWASAVYAAASSFACAMTSGKFSLPQEGEIAFSAADLGRLPEGFSEALSKAAKDSPPWPVSGPRRYMQQPLLSPVR